MMAPNNTKFRKAFKGSISGNATRGAEVSFGSYGIKAVEPERIDGRQLEAARRTITRHLRRAGKLWIRVFPDIPVSKKPADVRMGKGKGSVDRYVARVKPGTVLFELSGVEEKKASEAFKKAAAKLPVKVKFVKARV